MTVAIQGGSCIGKASFFVCRDRKRFLYWVVHGAKNNQDMVQNPARLLCRAETEMVTMATTNYL